VSSDRTLIAPIWANETQFKFQPLAFDESLLRLREYFNNVLMFFRYVLVCQLFLWILKRILFFKGLLLLIGYDIELQRIHILKIIESIG